MELHTLLIFQLVFVLSVRATLPLKDAAATVNQLFSYSIDPEDFPSKTIQVRQNGKVELPSWLEFDSETNELIGVPTAKDKGTYILSVDQEMFAVTVTEPTRNQVAQPANSEDQIICKPHDSITVVYVKMNAGIDTLPNVQKTRLVRSIASHLSLKPYHISISSDGKELVDTNVALVSGSGDAPSSSDSLSVLSWIVGCGAVKSHHMDILEKLQSSAKDGSLSKLLDTAVSGWQVQINQPKIVSKRRLKRQALVTATLTPTSSSAEAETTVKASSTTAEVTPTQTIPMSTTAKPTTPTTREPSEQTDAPEPTKPLNKKPEVHRDLLPTALSAKVGEIFRWEIPAGLFTDPEGDALKYSIESDSDNEQWMVTDKLTKTFEIIGLADKSPQNTAEQLNLTATDPSGTSVTVIIPIRHGKSENRYLTEKYTLAVELTELLSGPTGAIYLALTLAEEADFDNILVEKKGSDTDGIEMTIVVGDNRGPTTDCPDTKNSAILTSLRNLVKRDIPIVGTSEKMRLMRINSVFPISPCEDSKPVVNSEEIVKYRPLEVEVGRLYQSVLPINLFTDREDGDLSKMRVKMMVGSLEESDGWITLDTKTRTLQAFTWDTPNTPSQFTLIAMDSASNEVEEAISVKVVDKTQEDQETNLFTLTIDEQYSAFANTREKQIKMYKKLEATFDGSIVTVKSVKKGSVVIQFSLAERGSTVVPPDQCPKEIIESQKAVVFDGDEIKQSFVKKLGWYKVQSVEFVPLGRCVGVVDEAAAVVSNDLKEDPVKEPKPSKPSLITIIVPVVIGVLALIIIIVIVIVCVQKRKAKKANSGQNNSYIEKGVPAVMDEEKRSIDKAENHPLLMTSAEVSYKPTPPAYPKDDHPDDYQPDTPPVSEPDDEQRILGRSP